VIAGRKVIVIGGGIAGLAVAAILAQRGARVEVLEQAAQIAEVGAGLQISPNGAVVLRAMGLGDRLRGAGMRAGAVELCDGPSGARVTRLDLGALRAGQAYYFMHRADLIDLLADAARAAGAVISTGQTVTGVEGGEVRIGAATRRADLVIGADGLRSTARAALNGRAVPFFTHQVAWRALIPEAGARPEVTVHMGPGRHLVSYPLRGGGLRNLVAVEERHRWTEEGWHHRDLPDNLRAAFAGFGGPVPGWLDQLSEVHLWGLFRHPVAPVWQAGGQAGGHLAILGDAAHPTLPFLAQGANMALEDAWTLALALDGGEAPDAALARWQAARQPRVRRIVEAANRNARAYHLRGPMRGLAHLGLRLGGALAPGLALSRFDWLYGHDVTAGAKGAA
jgi:salicylate hydroxylase